VVKWEGVYNSRDKTLYLVSLQIPKCLPSQALSLSVLVKDFGLIWLYDPTKYQYIYTVSLCIARYYCVLLYIDLAVHVIQTQYWSENGADTQLIEQYTIISSNTQEYLAIHNNI
jgi:hypothetical protein